MACCVGKCWLLHATPSVLCCVVCSSVCGSVQQQEGLREHEKMNHPGIPAPRYTGIPPVNRGDGVARKKPTGKQGKPVNWRPVNRDIDCNERNISKHCTIKINISKCCRLLLKKRSGYDCHHSRVPIDRIPSSIRVKRSVRTLLTC